MPDELSATRWLRVREVFDLALDQPPEARAAFVAGVAGSDHALAREVNALLAALEHARATLEQPAAKLMSGALGDRDEAQLIGRRVGAYDVVRLVGYGGMGAVYEGVRADGDFDKRVAIKVMRPGMGSDIALRRFRYERQILASLNHKNIAGMFDGGVTEDGEPYFVMEYVEGTPLTTYCADQRLSIRERVTLFRQVCAAVQHAHQQLIVHRDLKPGNILVTGDGSVKLLDFGIAKLLREEEGPGQLPMTRGGMRVFTPEYASPEQVRGLALTPASDIYSLGVLLYELLVGHRPFSTDGKLLSEIEQEICHVPPTRPSAAVGAHRTTEFGETSAVRLRRQLAGDLDAIIQTALAKEAAMRYGTAQQLSDDLRHWLDGHPVGARKAWFGYRMRKFVLRNRYAVAAAALALVALIGGIVTTSRQARIARVEANKATEVNQFMIDMLSAADPGFDGRDVTVLTVLNRAAADVRTRQLDPEVEGQIRHTIAQTYYGLGLYDSSTVHAKRAFELRRQQRGLEDPSTLISMSYVVSAAEAQGAFVQAESLSRVALDAWRRIPDRSRTEEATALDNLARQLEHQGRLDESYALKLESIAIRRTLTDSASRADLPYTLNNLAVSAQYAGRFDEGERLLREALQVAAETHGRESWMYGEILKALASNQSEQQRSAQADSMIRESVTIMGKVLGTEHPNYQRVLLNQAEIAYVAGDMNTAVRAAAEVVRRIGTVVPEAEPAAAAALQVHGLALDSLKRYEEGGVSLQRSFELRARYLPAGHWATFSSQAVLGYHQGRMGRHQQGVTLMAQAYEKLAELRGADALVTRRVATRIAEVYGRWGKKADSLKWAAKAGE
jgi:serine/threonine-protein kinase